VFSLSLSLSTRFFFLVFVWVFPNPPLIDEVCFLKTSHVLRWGILPLGRRRGSRFKESDVMV
jgi:hypothetical protein